MLTCLTLNTANYVQNATYTHQKVPSHIVWVQWLVNRDFALPRMVPICYLCSILAVFITTLVVELVLG